MVQLTEKGLRELHKIVESKFPDTIVKGVKLEGLLKSVVERPDLKLFDRYEPFDNIFLKAASLMEAISRWHIFNDGNKRTGLLAAFAYLQANNHYLAIPLDAVRFTVQIVENTNQEPKATRELIEEIASWLEVRTGNTSAEYAKKAIQYVLLPNFKLLILNSFGFKKRVEKTIIYWFAIDMNKEYAKELDRIYAFLFETIKDSIKAILARRKIEKMMKKRIRNSQNTR